MVEVLAASPGGVGLGISAQFTRSALVGGVSGEAGGGFDDWWEERYRKGRFEVTRVPFADAEEWGFDPVSGNLGHSSGRYFTVEGLRISESRAVLAEQPILNQPEIGLLGILAKEFDGVLHFLMQAKMEPGNVNLLQLSPTVQATRSNYTRVHRGATTRYLEYFRGADRGEVMVDVLQSEQGAWFLGKRNRNMIVKVTGDVAPHEDFRWLTLPQIRALLTRENLVSMDSRTVLSCMPFAPPDESGAEPSDGFSAALLRSYGAQGLHPEREVLSWFTEAKTNCDRTTVLVPLAGLAGWTRRPDEITDEAERSFRILAVRVETASREVARWSQPLLAPRGRGTAVFLVRLFGGVLHVLTQALPQPGLRDLVELGPTVHIAPGEEPLTEDELVAQTLTTDPRRVRYDNVLSEEGGRFYHAETRYRVVEAGPELPDDVGETHRWLTVRQLMELVRHGHYLNIEARSLLACLHGLW